MSKLHFECKMYKNDTETKSFFTRWGERGCRRRALAHMSKLHAPPLQFAALPQCTKYSNLCSDNIIYKMIIECKTADPHSDRQQHAMLHVACDESADHQQRRYCK